MIDQFKDEIDSYYIADAGNLLFKKDSLEPGISKEIAMINANIILESFNKMGCHAFSLGQKDFSGGLSFVLEASESIDFPFISSNIYGLDGELLFDPYVIYETNGLQVAFVGLSSVFQSEGIQVKDPIESLKFTLEDIIPKTDIRILLFSSNNQDMQKIQTEDLDLDMVIRSRSKRKSLDGGKDIPSYSIGDRGRTLYAFDLEINDSSIEFIDIAYCEREIKESNINLNKMKKGNMLVNLRELFQDNPTALETIIRYENNIEDANQTLENAINKITMTKVDLGRTIDGRVDILKIVDEGKLKINTISSPQLDSQGHDHSGHNH